MSCDNTYFLDKRLKIFKADDSLWVFWGDRVKDTRESGTEESGTQVTVTAITPYINNGDSEDVPVTVQALPDNGSVLFITKSNTGKFNLPVDVDGTINPNVFWAGYIEEGIFKAIRGVKYYDLYYDKNEETIDLVFWSNVVVDDLPKRSQNVTSIDQFGESLLDGSAVSGTAVEVNDLYPDSLKEPSLNGGLDNNAQRVVFYTHGTLREVYFTLSNGSKIITNYFIFSKPALLFCPGRSNAVTADAVIDEAPEIRFLDLQ